MCPFCATKKAASNAYHQFMQRRKRARIYRNMPQSVSQTDTFGFRAGEVIETGNHPIISKAGESCQ